MLIELILSVCLAYAIFQVSDALHVQLICLSNRTPTNVIRNLEQNLRRFQSDSIKSIWSYRQGFWWRCLLPACPLHIAREKYTSDEWGRLRAYISAQVLISLVLSEKKAEGVAFYMRAIVICGHRVADITRYLAQGEKSRTYFSFTK